MIPRVPIMFRVQWNFMSETWLVAIQHGMKTGDGPLEVMSLGTLPIGLVSHSAKYWAIVRDADNFRLAASPENAAAGVEVVLTTPGVGVHLVGPAS